MLTGLDIVGADKRSGIGVVTNTYGIRWWQVAIGALLGGAAIGCSSAVTKHLVRKVRKWR